LFYYLGNNLNSLNRYSTIINLFAIQPKSIQEGQLIISSPEQSIKEQLVEQKIELKNTFPKPPSLDTLLDAIDIRQDNTIGKYMNKLSKINLNSKPNRNNFSFILYF